MRVDLFDFHLPSERIALRPAEPRESAKLLVIDPNSNGLFEDRIINDLPVLLNPGDVLVVNDTKVLPARLNGIRLRDGVSAKIEASLHKREGAALWRAFVKPAKKLRQGESIYFSALDAPPPQQDLKTSLEAQVKIKHEGGEVLLEFSRAGEALDAALAQVGRMPLPPYIESKRRGDDKDERDYQTLFASRPGAVAAPTASLHFTPELVAKLGARGVSLQRITLHVGAGTFLPVKVEDTRQHKMHAEWGEISEPAAKRLNQARALGGKIIAVGTTSLRILEAATSASGTIEPFSGETAIFIEPGYQFRAVDRLLTNFHLPRSTLFMLVCAFSGLDLLQAAYAHAIRQNYHFYSYGDACLLSLASPIKISA
jgi:S-adenosylmethionine:tRNA ribosyltransferase-isomerase